MSEYLCPVNKQLTISQKCKMFAVRNRMTNIPANFPNLLESDKCLCGEKEDMKHIYYCKMLNENQQKIYQPFENIFRGEIRQQIDVYKMFEVNLEKREKITKPPCDLRDPLFSVDYSNG